MKTALIEDLVFLYCEHQSYSLQANYGGYEHPVSKCPDLQIKDL